MTLVESTIHYKMHIPEYVENKIRHLCINIPNIEWSGVLFYTFEGSFENEDLVIKCEDILLMDIGDAATTEFNISPEVVSYMADNPELLKCQTALVHSHHTMKAFFSSTDLGTLRDRGEDMNHFVSLIVNNKREYVAAITRKVTTKSIITDSYSFHTFGDAETSGVGTREEERTIIEYSYLDIEFDSNNNLGELNARIADISDRKKEKNKTYKYTPNTYLYNNTPIYKSYKEENPLIQPSLFEEDNYTYKQSVSTYTDFKPKEDIIKSCVNQIITGSIIIPAESKIDLNKWVSNMTKLYGRRFGTDTEGKFAFEEWADFHIETILMNIKDDNYSGEEEQSLMSIYAEAIIDELNKFPHNYYLDHYTESLNNFLEA